MNKKIFTMDFKLKDAQQHKQFIIDIRKVKMNRDLDTEEG